MYLTHPTVMSWLAEEQHRERLAKAARERLAAQARPTTPTAVRAAEEAAGPRLRFVLVGARCALTSLTAVAFGFTQT